MRLSHFILDLRRSGMMFMALYLCTMFIFNDIGISMLYPSAILVAILFFECVLIFSSRDSRKVKLSQPTLLFLSIFCVVVIRMLLTSDWHNREIQFYFLTCICSSGIVVLSVDSYLAKKWILRIVLFTGMFINSLVIVSRLMPKQYQNVAVRIVTPSVMQYNEHLLAEGYSCAVYENIAYTLAMVIAALCITLYQRNMNRIIRFMCIIFLYCGMILAGRRTELLFGTLMIMITFIMQYRREIREFINRHAALVLIAIAVSLCLFLVGLIYLSRILNHYTGSSRYINTILGLRYKIDISNGRSGIYMVALNLLKQNMLTGIGWMRFREYAYLSGDLLASNVHNIYLQLYTENGIVIGSGLVGLLFLELVVMIRNIKRSRDAIIGVEIMLYILLVGLLDNTLYFGIFWGSLAIGVYFARMKTYVE